MSCRGLPRVMRLNHVCADLRASIQQTDGRRRSYGTVARLLRCGACRPALVAPTMVWGVQAGVGGIYYGVGRAGRRWWRLLRCGACRPALVAPTTVLGVQAGVGGTYYGVGRAGRRWWHLLRCGACRPALVAPTTVWGVQAGVGGIYYGVGRAGRRWWNLLRCGACRPALVEVPVLGTHQRRSGERVCSVDQMQPTPAIDQASLLVQGLQAWLDQRSDKRLRVRLGYMFATCH